MKTSTAQKIGSPGTGICLDLLLRNLVTVVVIQFKADAFLCGNGASEGPVLDPRRPQEADGIACDGGVVHGSTTIHRRPELTDLFLAGPLTLLHGARIVLEDRVDWAIGILGFRMRIFLLSSVVSST